MNYQRQAQDFLDSLLSSPSKSSTRVVKEKPQTSKEQGSWSPHSTQQEQQTKEEIWNDGSRDIGSIPSRFLIVLGLKCDSPSHIYEQTSLGVRFYLVRKRDTQTPLSFGFAEFQSEKEAYEVLQRVYNGHSIQVDGQPIAISYAHRGSFLTVPPDSLYISFSCIENDQEVYKRYWDESCYCDAYPPLPFTIKTCINKPTPIKVKKELLITTSIPSKKLVSQFQKWQETQKHFDIAGVSIPVLFERVPTVDKVNQEYVCLSLLVCKLCKRKFKTECEIEKHVELSKMHQQQVRFLRKKRLDMLMSVEAKVAKEKAMYEEIESAERVVRPTRFGIRGDNVGNKMMQQMGWKQGQGLGVDGQGIKKAIKLERRKKGAGLGTKNALLGSIKRK